MPSLTGIDLGARVVSKLSRRLLPFLFLLYIVAYLDRINVGFAALQMKGQLGCIAPGALGDLLVVDGDPLKDIGLLAADGRALRAIVRAGELVKNELS